MDPRDTYTFGCLPAYLAVSLSVDRSTCVYTCMGTRYISIGVLSSA